MNGCMLNPDGISYQLLIKQITKVVIFSLFSLQFEMIPDPIHSPLLLGSFPQHSWHSVIHTIRIWSLMSWWFSAANSISCTVVAQSCLCTCQEQHSSGMKEHFSLLNHQLIRCGRQWPSPDYTVNHSFSILATLEVLYGLRSSYVPCRSMH